MSSWSAGSSAWHSAGVNTCWSSSPVVAVTMRHAASNSLLLRNTTSLPAVRSPNESIKLWESRASSLRLKAASASCAAMVSRTADGRQASRNRAPQEIRAGSRPARMRIGESGDSSSDGSFLRVAGEASGATNA
jgi:hypothetical protein